MLYFLFNEKKLKVDDLPELTFELDFDINEVSERDLSNDNIIKSELWYKIGFIKFIPKNSSEEFLETDDFLEDNIYKLTLNGKLLYVGQFYNGYMFEGLYFGQDYIKECHSVYDFIRCYKNDYYSKN